MKGTQQALLYSTELREKIPCLGIRSRERTDESARTYVPTYIPLAT